MYDGAILFRFLGLCGLLGRGPVDRLTSLAFPAFPCWGIPILLFLFFVRELLQVFCF